ncbi:hypothetical protein D1872_264720 [compost metagenome]
MFELYLFGGMLLLIVIATFNKGFRVKLNGRVCHNLMSRFIISFFVVNILVGLPIWIIGRVVISFL